MAEFSSLPPPPPSPPSGPHPTQSPPTGTMPESDSSSNPNQDQGHQEDQEGPRMEPQETTTTPESGEDPPLLRQSQATTTTPESAEDQGPLRSPESADSNPTQDPLPRERRKLNPPPGPSETQRPEIGAATLESGSSSGHGSRPISESQRLEIAITLESDSHGPSESQPLLMGTTRVSQTSSSHHQEVLRTPLLHHSLLPPVLSQAHIAAAGFATHLLGSAAHLLAAAGVIIRALFLPNYRIPLAFAVLVLYLLVGGFMYNPDHYHDEHPTTPIVDSLYYNVVTLTTVGFGDIFPKSSKKMTECALVVAAVAVVNLLVSSAVDRAISLLERKMGGLSFKLKAPIAACTAFFSIMAGMWGHYYFEIRDWTNSLYLSVMSVSTVGYGDQAFKTMGGRIFASIWLIISTIAVGKAVNYIATAFEEKQTRDSEHTFLQKNFTSEDFNAADIHHTGSVGESDYVLFALKETGRLREEELTVFRNRFNTLANGQERLVPTDFEVP